LSNTNPHRIDMADAADLGFFGGESLTRHGTLSRRTATWEDNAETHTRSSDGSLIERDGVLKSAGSNVPRVEWVDTDSDGTRDTPTLLLEGARTNGWTYSEQADNAAWSKIRLTVSANAVVAPDGTTTADKFVEDGTADNTHSLRRSVPTLTDNTAQSISCYAKAGERTMLYITSLSKAGTTRYSYFNLSTGAVGTSQHNSNNDGKATIEDIGGGWYRCSISGWDSASGGSAPNHDFGMATVDGQNWYGGDSASGLYVWGVQVEVDQPFVSSYIQTVASTVTRNADNMYFDWPFPPQEMTVYVKFVTLGTGTYNPGGAGSAGGIVYIGSATDGTDTRLMIGARGDAAGFRMEYDDGTTSSDSQMTTTPAIGDTIELRATLSASAVAQLHESINGGSEGSGGTGSASTFTAAFAGERCYINSRGSTIPAFAEYHVVKIARGTKTMAQMRTL